MNKVIITGATSMIGVALVKECLNKNVQVLAVVRPKSNRISRLPKSDLLEIYEGDINDLLEDDNINSSYDVLYHFAWANTDKVGRNDVDFQVENIGITLDAVRLAKKFNCKLFVGAGSQAEYGVVKEIISEKTPTEPIIAYGAAKQAANHLSRILCQSNNITHVWVRIFSIYGTNDNENTMIRYSLEQFFNNETPHYLCGEQYWDYLFEDDCARAFYLIGDKVKKDETYCLASGDGLKLKDYVEMIRETLNPNLQIVFEKPRDVSKMVSLKVNMDKLKEDVGFYPTISFKQGILCCYNEYLKEKKV